MIHQGLLEALSLEKDGSWEKAHSIVQDMETKEAAMVHAYLHRVEGDEFNAGYWYRKAGKGPFNGSTDEEWSYLESLLSGKDAIQLKNQKNSDSR